MNKRLFLSVHTHLSRWKEMLLAAFCFASLFVSLANYAPGGPIGTDVTLYLNIGINGLKSVSVIYNRYFHILFQRVFIKSAVTPLQGAQFFWAFLMAAICLMVYVDARLFSRKSRPLHGLIAVALFLSIAIITDSVGITLVDTTAMFIVMVLVTAYVLSTRSGHHSGWLIGLIGFIFYLTVKTKETTLPIAILFLGLGFNEENKFIWPAFFRRMLLLFIGFIVGLLFFSGWTWITVGDPLFGLRPSEFSQYLALMANGSPTGPAQTSTNNWFTSLFFTSLLVPFILYIISGFKSSGLNLSRRLVWLVPLLIILFVSITVGNRWGFQGRFIFPSLPVISFLAVQFLEFEIPAERREQIFAGVLFLAGLALLVILKYLMRFLPQIGWDLVIFINVIYNPLFLICILTINFLLERPGIKSSVLNVLVIIALLTSPLVRNFKEAFLFQPNRQTADVIFYPFSTFSKQIVYTPEMHMFISSHVWVVLGNPWYTKNVDEVLDTFNVYFNVNSTSRNFEFTGDFAAISGADFTYLLLTSDDLQKIDSDQQVQALLEQKYQSFYDPQHLLVLLIAH